ncbi:MAG TPA: hypothetical protein VM490_20220, partial [Armatimonadaceae bacterium]|nr:hypothetical protein [Armatimonadaceae bacterium]
ATPGADHGTTDPGDVQPCPQMRTFLSQLADGTARGLVRWYAERHVARCGHCSAALAGLRNLRTRLRAFGIPPPPMQGSIPVPALTQERRSALEAALARVEEERNR